RVRAIGSRGVPSHARRAGASCHAQGGLRSPAVAGLGGLSRSVSCLHAAPAEMDEHAGDLTAEEVSGQIMGIVARCEGATAPGSYADGYRAAAADIRGAIQARFADRPVAPWERDVREVEIEARALSKVSAVLRRQQARASSALVRRALSEAI